MSVPVAYLLHGVKRVRNSVPNALQRFAWGGRHTGSLQLCTLAHVEHGSDIATVAEQHTLACTSSAQLTGVQRSAIPKICAGHDTILHAPTGSGKTLAYLAPIMQSLKHEEEALDIVARPGRPRAIVLVPTRELVQQVKVRPAHGAKRIMHMPNSNLQDVAKQLAHRLKLRVVSVFGGGKRSAQKAALLNSPDVLVCTPGRLLALMEKGHISFADTRVCVLDEADTLLHAGEGFRGDVHGILRKLAAADEAHARTTQYILAGATASRSTEKAASALTGRHFTQAADSGRDRTPDSLAQHFVHVRGGKSGNKQDMLLQSIRDFYSALKPTVLGALQGRAPAALPSIPPSARAAKAAATAADTHFAQRSIAEAGSALKSPRVTRTVQDATAAVSAAYGCGLGANEWSSSLRDQSHGVAAAGAGDASGGPMSTLLGLSPTDLAGLQGVSAGTLAAVAAVLPRTIVFANTAASVRSTGWLLEEAGIPNVALHKDMPFEKRRAQFDAFKHGRVPVLVCSDAGARGIDLPRVGHVINFDFPASPVEFIHRVGRTARAGQPGIATSLVTRKDLPLARAVHAAGQLGTPLAGLSSDRAVYLRQLSPERASVAQSGGKERPKATRRRMLPAKRRAMLADKAKETAHDRMQRGQGFTAPMQQLLQAAPGRSSSAGSLPASANDVQHIADALAASLRKVADTTPSTVREESTEYR